MGNTIGNDTKLYRNVVIKDTIIGDNSVLGDDSFVTGSHIGKYCTIERRGMIFNSTIGDYSYTGYNTVVKYAAIGKFCSVGWNASIGGADHDLSHVSTHPFSIKSRYGFIDKDFEYGSFEANLSVGNDVWIGANAQVLRGRGIVIGDGAVIGAGSVVTKSVPPYAIVAGVPAKIIRFRFSDEIIKRLLKIKWWDFPTEVLKDNITLFSSEPNENSLEKMEEIRAEMDFNL